MESEHRLLPPNPREKANILSVLTFWWTIDLFKKGYRKALEIGDLFKPLNEDRSEILGDRLDAKWKKQENGPGRPSILKAVASTFWREYTILGLIVFMNETLVRIGQPLLLGRLLMYFRKDSDMTHKEALYCAGGIVGLSLFSVITVNQFTFGSFYVGMRVRIAMCSIIYRKALRLSRTALGDTAPGKVVNLLSNDVNRFDMVSVFIHSMWSAPLFAILIGYFLWANAGWAGLVGIIVVFTVVPIQSYTGKLSSIFRLQTALKTDERVRFMDEIISGVQVIKMYAWEKPFSKLITLARKLELRVVRKSSYVRGLYMIFLLFTTRMALFCTMLTMALMGDEITATKIFVISAYFNILAHTMSQMFVRGVAEIAEVLVALKRLQKFLTYEEKGFENDRSGFLKEFGLNGDITEKEKLLESETNLPSKVAVSVKNANARWTMPLKAPKKNKSSKQKRAAAKDRQNDENVDEIEKPMTLENINLECKKGMLVGIVGPVGAGKSSLLQAILRELPLESGSITVRGEISYACQEPWVFAASVRQNILFGQEMDRERYDAVVKACALSKDFEQLPFGDQTIIGERGASLSGGQKARVSLARAIYRKADVYLLDDPLSAVDAHVGRHLFDACIGPKGRLGNRRHTRILVTHQVHFLKEADWVVVLKDGHIEIQGPPAELLKSGVDFANLLGIEEEVEGDHESFEESFTKLSLGWQRSRSSSKSIHSSFQSLDASLEELDTVQKQEKEEAPPQTNLEASSKGTVKGSIMIKYLNAGAHPLITAFILLLFIMTQFLASAADWWVSYWTSQEELRSYNERLNNSGIIDRINSTDYIYNQSIPESIFYKNEDGDSHILTTEMCIYINGALMAALFIVGLSRSISFYSICIRASKKLHFGMFNGVVSTTMRFFDTNPSGRILNRFSKDMGAMDEYLPKAILDAAQITLSMVGAIIVAATVNPLFLIPIAVLSVIFMFVRRVYLKTSKNIKRLDGITRSPVFTHLAASLSGLPTIRAFEAQDILIKEFDALQDIHTASWYMFITTSTAFGLVLDLLCVIFVFFVTFSFLLMEEDTMGDQVGLAITQALILTGMLQWGIRQSAEVANQMMSVERVIEYCHLKSEKQPDKPRQIDKFWPTGGKIEFKTIFYRYAEGVDPVLKGVSLVILPNEKIGIVGRTGAGKSSLIGTLFRLAEIESDIEIDGVNTATVSLQDLRSKISIIPQDPVLFSGTLRRNLDPFEEYGDAAIWKSLEQVELKEVASGPLGLQTEVLAGGANFSVGQRQLICLARAILRNNKILVLDEATANVDPHTDTLIQSTIRSRFKNCTVLTVAHRLHTIMDSDRVLVMDDGMVREFATAHELIQIPDGLFRAMVDATGSQEAERLIKIARDKYESIKKEL